MQIEKTIKDNKEKLPIAEINAVETAIEVAKKVHTDQSADAQVLQKAADDLIQASYKIAEILYKEKQQQAGQPGQDGQQAGDQNAGEGNNDKSNDKPIDTDFEEKK
jgi:molecular chaperone DnaK